MQQAAVLLTRSALGRAPALAPTASIAWMTEPGVTGFVSTSASIAASTLYALALFEAVQYSNKVGERGWSGGDRVVGGRREQQGAVGH